MMTVRFPSGLALTYNAAMFLRYPSASSEGTWELYTADPSKGGKWVASIQPSAGIVLEVTRPCMVKRDDQPDADQILRSLRGMGGRDLARLKAALRAFNATRGSWS